MSLIASKALEMSLALLLFGCKSSEILAEDLTGRELGNNVEKVNSSSQMLVRCYLRRDPSADLLCYSLLICVRRRYDWK
jgi:hypothetical protein